MPPRDALWKGYVSFGLVEIPVELVSAEESKDISFNLFDKRDRSPVGNKRINKNTGEDVPWGEVVKGYEYSPDEYVLLSDEEIRSANPKATQTVEILDFVDAADVHPAYFDKPYYLRPARKRGQKAYALLHETLAASGQIGIAHVVIRTKEHLAALVTRGPSLMLCLLRFAHELREPAEIGLPAETAKELGLSRKELDMAARLVDDMKGKWKPEKYTDDYRSDVLAMIERKVKAGKLEAIDTPERAPAEEDKRGDVLDLMPLLKRSVEQAGGRGGGRGRTADAKRAAPRTATKRATRAPRRKARAAAPAAKRVPARRRSA